MKLVSYLKDDQDQLAFLVDGLLYDTDLMHPEPAGKYEHVSELLGRCLSNCYGN